MYARVCVSVHFAAAAAAVVCIESASENIRWRKSCFCSRVCVLAERFLETLWIY